ncbi:MAG: hypothetical protein JEZ00_18060 [Anaerolineaceae bacterium]|nr:hypothetical protein [Anaerolineaceae bacterium]
MRKGVLWLLLGVFSTAIAEVSISSSPLVFFSSYGILFVLPLYTLHILFLSSIAMKKSQTVRFSSLIFAGALFGLYEAYITKVLWNPPWNTESITFMQVSVFTFLVLVFFYHTWMSFIFPLLIVEHFVFSDQRIFDSLPVGLQKLFSKRAFVILMIVFFGIANGISNLSIADSIVSVFGTSAIMYLLLVFTRRLFAGSDKSLVDFLPRGIGLWIIFAGILVTYGLHLFDTRPEAFPGWIGHLMILTAYLVFGILLYRSQRGNQVTEVPEISIIPQINRIWVAATLLFAINSLIAVSFLKVFQPLFVGILWAVGIPFGLWIFGKAVKNLSNKNDDLSTSIPLK